MSVMISRLRHHGAPGLQAQKCSSTVKITASMKVMGMTFSMVSPSISATCMGRLDIVASLLGLRVSPRPTPRNLREGEVDGRFGTRANCECRLKAKFTLTKSIPQDAALRVRINRVERVQLSCSWRQGHASEAIQPRWSLVHEELDLAFREG